MMHEPLKWRINRLGSISALYTLWISLEREGGYFPSNSQYTLFCLGWHVQEMGWEGQNSLQNQREILSWKGRKFCRSYCRIKKQLKVRTGTHKSGKMKRNRTHQEQISKMTEECWFFLHILRQLENKYICMKFRQYLYSGDYFWRIYWINNILKYISHRRSSLLFLSVQVPHDLKL